MLTTIAITAATPKAGPAQLPAPRIAEVREAQHRGRGADGREQQRVVDRLVALHDGHGAPDLQVGQADGVEERDQHQAEHRGEQEGAQRPHAFVARERERQQHRERDAQAVEQLGAGFLEMRRHGQHHEGPAHVGHDRPPQRMGPHARGALAPVAADGHREHEEQEGRVVHADRHVDHEAPEGGRMAPES
ncbi:hypothetical protein [Variovorax sp. TBS-050B]|uniref:hypothetical protein n=1 Tax=Variovorax sp. TBS-050B TaxID=2940551 RepID=UPI00247716A3|nr:hypothetical protein [Variovorax sp. TBS-050B]